MNSQAVMLEVFRAPRALVGMIHAGALPGTPAASLGVDDLAERAVAESLVYRDAGYTAVLVENMHDVPYVKGPAGPEVTAAMTAIVRAVRLECGLPVGVQVLAGANREAVAVAHAAGAAFVRVEGFVFAHVGDEGLHESDAGALLRYRRSIGADAVRVFADIKKKHSSHALTADVDLAGTARAAEFFRADGVIVTGPATGREADPAEVAAVSEAVGVPTFVGSGVSPDQLPGLAAADGFIVGSWVKRDGVWSHPLDRERVEQLARAFERLPAKAVS